MLKSALYMEETGYVIRVDGPHAVVSVARKSACSHCTAGVCHEGGGQGMEIEAFNEAGAKVGERVRVNMREDAFVSGSLVLYGVPALALVAGAVIGKEFLSGRFPGVDPQGITAAAAFAGLALGIGIAWAVDRLMRRGQGASPRLVAVVEAVLEDENTTS